MRSGYPQWLLLPEFLDTVNRRRPLFRIWADPNNHDLNNPAHRQLLSAIGSHLAFICSAMAQYLFRLPNTQQGQRHYTMPNRFHDEWFFWSGEQFWTKILNHLSHVRREQSNLRWPDPLRTNPNFWCPTYQAGAELSIAFARAALVVGRDFNKNKYSRYHAGVLPDTRHLSAYSRDPRIRSSLVERRTEACLRRQTRAQDMMYFVTLLQRCISVNHQAKVTLWLSKYEEIEEIIRKAYERMAYN